MYFKNATMRELDESIGDIYGQIVDFENVVIRELEQAVLNCHKELIDVRMILCLVPVTILSLTRLLR